MVESSSVALSMTIDIRRSDERFATTTDWLDSKHSFSFGPHRDPANTHHGLLLVSNDDVVEAGTGFGMHPHRDMEIVTWVLSGSLEHRDSEGNHGIIYPGLAQRMSAGTGIHHSEQNASADADVRLVQMWVLPDTEGIAPEYEQRDLGDALDSGEFVAVASGQGHAGAVAIHQREAALFAARPHPDTTLDVPDAGHVHVYVAKGAMTLTGGESPTRLGTGDAARLTEPDDLRLIDADDDTEVLVWATA